jgi:hypothetical protein
MQNLLMQGKSKKSNRTQSERTLRQWMGASHHNMAVISNLQGKHEVALQHAQHALNNRQEIRKHASDQKGVNVPVSSVLPMIYSLIELGLAYYGAGCFVESQEVLLEALQVTYSLFHMSLLLSLLNFGTFWAVFSKTLAFSFLLWILSKNLLKSSGHCWETKTQ